MQMNTIDSKLWFEEHKERQQQVMNQFLRQTLGKENTKKDIFSLVNQEKSSSRADTFVKSTENESVFVRGTGGKVALRYQGEYLSETLMKMVNSSHLSYTENLIICNGIAFDREQIPSLAGETFEEIKAKDNVVDFGHLNYFTYISSDGTKHNLFAANYHIGAIKTEQLREESHDEQLQRYAGFWNYLLKAQDGIYICEYYSREEVIGYLKEMGIEPGFFTIKVGDVEKVYYYTTHEYSIPVKSKERYDEQYQGLTDTTYGPVSIFRDFPPNATIEGKECNYTINENGGLDIPYGADVWDLKWTHPSKG